MRNLASLALILVVALEANPATVAAQARQSAPPAQAASARRGPDLLGLYPRMPAAEARRRLQAHSDANRVQDLAPNNPELGFTLLVNDPQGGSDNIIMVYVTAAPNAPVVWAITNTASYAATNGRLDNLVAKSTLLATLREKYGKETTLQESGPTRTTYWWFFEQNGQQVASADLRTLKSCLTLWKGYTAIATTTLPPPPSAQLQPCLSSYYAVSVELSLYGPQVVNGFEATLVNLPLGYRAAVATINARSAAAEAARKQELEKARKKKPVF